MRAYDQSKSTEKIRYRTISSFGAVSVKGDRETGKAVQKPCLFIAKFHYTDPTRTRPDPHGPARTFFAAELRWVRAGPVGSV